MLTFLRATAIIVVVSSGLASSALAHRLKMSGLRDAAPATPVKDCTRFNGRSGYYGNLWCTPAEQDRWDRWEAKRLRSR